MDKRDDKIRDVAAMCLMITVLSFLGFCVETVFVAFTGGYIDNRNMLFPFLLGYGLSICAMYLAIGTPKAPRFFGIKLGKKSKLVNLLIYFAIAFFVVSIGECSLGLFVEKTCNITWWDYSAIPLHFTKFTSVPTSLGLTSLLAVFTGLFFEPMHSLFKKVNKKALYPLAIIFMALMIFDFVYTGIWMYKNQDLMVLWRIYL